METKDQLISSFTEVSFNDYTMPIICIYKSPSDHQGMFVARVFNVNKPQPIILMRPSVEAIRSEIPEGFSIVPKSEDDDPAIVESWI
ncbi:hypothetical protein [Bacillus sp. AK031]